VGACSVQQKLAAASSGNWELRKALLSSGFDLVAEPERRAGPWLGCWSNGGDARQQKGFVSPFLAACKASGSGCFEERNAFHKPWSAAAVVQDGSLPAQVIWRALLFVLKCISSCGLCFPCSNCVQLFGLGILVCEHLCWMFKKAEMSD